MVTSGLTLHTDLEWKTVHRNYVCGMRDVILTDSFQMTVGVKILRNISLLSTTCEIINCISFPCSSVSAWSRSSETSAAWLAQPFLELSPSSASAWHRQLHCPQSLFPLLCGWLVKEIQHKEPANKLNWTVLSKETSSAQCTLHVMPYESAFQTYLNFIV